MRACPSALGRLRLRSRGQYYRGAPFWQFGAPARAPVAYLVVAHSMRLARFAPCCSARW